MASGELFALAPIMALINFLRLQEGIQNQYTNAENSLDKRAELDRDIHLSAMGARQNVRRKVMGFGASIPDDQDLEKKRSFRVKYTAKPVTVRQKVGFVKKLNFHVAEAKENGTDTVGEPYLPRERSSQRTLRSTLSRRSMSIGREKSSHSIGSSKSRNSKSIRQRAKPAFDLAAILARLPPSKMLEELLEEEEGMHWRYRVKRAKMRLYWYLRVYAKWMSILKKKRKGYAEPFSTSSLPNTLASKLGPHREPFLGFMLKYHAAESGVVAIPEEGKKTYDESEDHPYPQASPVRPASSTLLELGKSPFANLQVSVSKSVDLPSRKSSHSGTVSNLSTPGATIIPRPPSSGLPGPRPNGRVRALSSTGGGGLTTAAPFVPTVREKSKTKAIFAFGRVVEQEPVRKSAPQPMSVSVEQDRLSAPVKLSQIPDLDSPKPKKDTILKVVEDLLPSKSPEAGMVLYANRANAMWVEAQFSDHAEKRGESITIPKSLANESSFHNKVHGWTPPTVLDYNKLAKGEMGNYAQYVSTLVTEGKIAVQLTYLGEKQSLELEERLDNSADASATPAIELDLWAAIAHLFPHRIPPGARLNGLTLLDRQIIQTLVNIEKMSNKQQAVLTLTMVLCVHSSYVDWVAEQVVARKHWGLPPQHIIILSIANLPPIVWDSEKKNVNVSYSTTKHPFQHAGSGYSLLAAGWPGEAFWMDPVSKNRTYFNTSVLHILSKAKVEFIYSSRLTDYAHLNLSSPTLDPTFLAPAIYAMDNQGATIAAEVSQGGSDALLRKLGIIAMSRAGDRNSCCLISASDLETIYGRSLVALANKQPGGMWGGNSRYLFKVDDLIKKLTSSKAFRWTIRAQAPCVYLSMDVVDLTSNQDFKCVAIAGRSQGPNASSNHLASEPLREMAMVLRIQENQPNFKSRAMKTCINNFVSTLENASSTGLDDFELRPPGSCRILLIAGNNPSSRLGFRLCESLVRHRGDTIFIVHFVKGSSSPAEVQNAVGMLNTFTDIRIDHILRRKVATIQGSFVESVEIEIEKLSPDLVVIGTEGQAPGMQAQSVRPSNWTSGSLDLQLGDNVAVALLKQAPLVPLLIVKPESVGPLSAGLSLALKSRDEGLGKVRGGARVMMEVGTTQTPMFEWISHRLTPCRDRFVFVRPHGKQSEGEEKRTSERLLKSYALQAQLKGFEESDCLAVTQGRREGLPDVVTQRKPDVLCLQAPDVRSTPPEIIELVKSSRTSLLIWRPVESKI